MHTLNPIHHRPPHVRHRRALLPAAGLAIAGLLGTACGDGAGATPITSPPAGIADVETVALSTVEYGFDIPPLSAGTVRLDVTNEGEQPHHTQVLRLAEGVTEEAFFEAAAAGEAELLAVTAPVGGTGTVDPGATSAGDGIIDLAEGLYVFLCFIPDVVDGAPHFAKGMIEVVEVAAPAQEATVAVPTEGTIAMFDYGFDAPTELTAGTWAFANDGDEWHEANVLALPDGVAFEDVLEFFQAPTDGPPPFASVGGQQAIAPGDVARAVLDLEPGRYVFLCFVPTMEGVPHFANGMIREVTVTG